MNEERKHPSGPSDARQWRGAWLGLYVNARDRRLWVPKKRPGIAWTLNLGHPRARTVMAALLTVLVTGVVAAILLDAG